MGSDKLFKEHEAAKRAAEQATRRNEDSIKTGGKAREPDNEGTRSKQIAPVRREVRKGK